MLDKANANQIEINIACKSNPTKLNQSKENQTRNKIEIQWKPNHINQTNQRKPNQSNTGQTQNRAPTGNANRIT